MPSSRPTASQRARANAARTRYDAGGQGTQSSTASAMSQQVLAYLAYPFSACIPSSSTQPAVSQREEQQSLLTDNAYDDSDAISLLSNIADRSRRRNRAARRREQWNNRAAVLGCGLFGRPKGQIERRQTTLGDGERTHRHTRTTSADSAASSAVSTDDESVGPTASLSAAQESGDEDAGLLGDSDIAEISHTHDDAADEASNEAEPAIAEAESKAEAEAAKRKEELQRQAEEDARKAAEQLAQQQEEEAALAAEEEAAVAKARRRAERKAIKQGLLTAQAQGQREGNRRLTEAEAEAAAGGFDFAEEPPMEYDEPRQMEGYEEQYDGNTYQPDDFGYNDEAGFETAPPQQEVIHHHHYYHEPPVQTDEYEAPGYQTFMPPIPHIADPSPPDDATVDEEEDDEDEDEDDADIAGLAFGKSRKKRAERDGYGSRSNGSGSGSRQSGSASHVRRLERPSGGSNGSAGRRREARVAADDGSSNGDESGTGKRSYRDRPRRHERTGSRSTGSGAGRTLREGPLGGGSKVVTSPTIPEADSSRDFAIPAAGDDRADAAAGGFDDYLSPPPSSGVSPNFGTQWRRDSDSVGLPAAEPARRTSLISPPSSTSARSGRRREGPRKPASRANESGAGGGLNAPRNPQGGNIFTQRFDNTDGL